jgi:hypothetical protein
MVGFRNIVRAVALEKQTLSLSSLPNGMLYLQVSTPYKQKTVKVIKGD